MWKCMNRSSQAMACFFCVIHLSIMASDDKITVRNVSKNSVFTAIYKKESKDNAHATRVSDVVEIGSGTMTELTRPDYGFFAKLTIDRQLFFSHDKEKLAADIDHEQAKTIPWIGIGSVRGTKFWIAEKKSDKTLHGYNAIEWFFLQPLKDGVMETVSVINMIGAYSWLRIRNTVVPINPFSKERPTVRVLSGGVDTLCAQEREFIKNRIPKVTKAVSSFIERPLTDKEEAPRIVFLFSGGAYRAMLGALGAIQGLQKIGLYDASMYNISLSGSTWGLAGYMVYGKSLKEYIEQLYPRIEMSTDKLVARIDRLPDFIDQAAQAYLKGDAFSYVIETFGFLLGEALLRDLRKGIDSDQRTISLPDQIPYIETGEHPLPIYSAAITKTAAGDPTDYMWAEFSPYEIGSVGLRSFIPSYAFGWDFYKGALVRADGAGLLRSLSYLMGIWGSAPSVRLKDVFPGNYPMKMGDLRIDPAKVNNFSFGISQSPMAELKRIVFIDGGISINVPFPLVWRPARDVDLIIAFDFSEPTPGQGKIKGYGAQLKKAQEYAKKNGIEIPDINFDSAAKKSVSYFKSTRPGVASIIYIPFIKNEGFSKKFDPEAEMKVGKPLSSLNFSYTREQAKNVVGLPAYVVEHNTDMFKQAVEDAIELRAQKLKKGSGLFAQLPAITIPEGSMSKAQKDDESTPYDDALKKLGLTEDEKKSSVESIDKAFKAYAQRDVSAKDLKKMIPA
ncbi:MAG: hypothetical protein UU47_C0012G0020 [candidate division TM6 bacterium GW2011_GWE2_41_16]|nr:MAG: hypothetical protein UU47_C0012G0020 [candidate division TM6 bacterium GW2011_GWE2_41_16]